MTNFETIKTLADFKRFISANLNNPNILLSSKVINNGTGEIVKDNPPAMINHVQTNAFGVSRNNTISWMEFGKAANWVFYGSDEAELKAKYNVMPNKPNFCHIIFTIHKK